MLCGTGFRRDACGAVEGATIFTRTFFSGRPFASSVHACVGKQRRLCELAEIGKILNLPSINEYTLLCQSEVACDACGRENFLPCTEL